MTTPKQQSDTDRLRELSQAPIGKLLFKYSTPAVVGTVVMALYHIIDSVVIGHAINDPNVVAGIAVTFPVTNLATALGMLIGAGAATRISIVLGQKDKKRAQMILGNSIVMTLIIGIIYMSLFAIFIDPILKTFGASENSLPYAREFMLWMIPGMVLINLTFSYNNVMRATGYPRKAMYTNFIGAILNMILAPLFLFCFDMGIRGAAIATDISMAITVIFVMSHFFNQKNTLAFTHGTFRLKRRIVSSVISIGMAPFLINVAGSLINAIVNNTLMKYGGDNAIASVVVFNRFTTIFIFIVIGICQGMQPILGYNYGAGRYNRLFRTLLFAGISATAVTTIGSLCGHFFPTQIASMFMQDPTQIDVAENCLKLTTLGFWIVGAQVVITNFFQSLGMAGKAIFLSLTRQILFMIPMLIILPPILGLNGVWSAFPICDGLSTIVSATLLIWQIHLMRKRIKAQS